MFARVTVILILCMSIYSVHMMPFGILDRFANSNSLDSELLAKHKSTSNQVWKYVRQAASNLGKYFKKPNKPAKRRDTKKILTQSNNIRKG